MDAVLRANAAADLFILPTAQAWLALCVEVSHDRTFARIQRAIRKRTLSNLLHSLTPLLSRAGAVSFAQDLSALIDSLWLQCATGD